MSRMLARSLFADLLARGLNGMLFLLLVPLILALAFRVPPGPTRHIPFSAPLPRDVMTEAS